MTSASRRLSAAIAAALLSLTLVGCEQEPSTTPEGEAEQPVPGEPDAPEPSPGPDAEDAADVDAEELPQEDQEGTATRGD